MRYDVIDFIFHICTFYIVQVLAVELANMTHIYTCFLSTLYQPEAHQE